MNFVDVQPKSFLDYAWTTPSPAPMNTTKPSKTSRKQNRCCDQCRKGKRACDAAILEDTLLDESKAGGNPTVFHYSDVFGPLAQCGNCQKTKKNCTFEWLRSQRVSQAAAPSSTPAPPAKRRRTQSNSSNTPHTRGDLAKQLRASEIAQPNTLLRNGNTGDYGLYDDSTAYGVTFADFPGGIPAFDLPSSTSPLDDAAITWDGVTMGIGNGMNYLSDVLEDGESPLDRDSGNGSSLTSSESLDGTESSSSCIQSVNRNDEDPSKANTALIRIPRKRRRRSTSSTKSTSIPPYYSISFVNDFLSSTNNAFLTESLLKIYHDSFENALSCWLTERTCPYSKDSDVSLANDAGPDWNRIYHRVFRLDRLATPIRGRQLTYTEDKAASRAINLAIFSFATQWAQSSQRSRSKYPFHSDGTNGRTGVFVGDEDDLLPNPVDFDRALQVSAWHEARMALQNAAEIESFRVVLAQIVFSLTQKPFDTEEEHPKTPEEPSKTSPFKSSENGDQMCEVESPGEDKDVNECEDLLSKLNLTIDADGPPIHLEQGLRLIHSLRSRMAMSGNMPKGKPPVARCGKPVRPAGSRLDAADKATVDLLFWLGIMFDTLSSAMHKRPLVVSDEDSDIYTNGPRPIMNGAGEDSVMNAALEVPNAKSEGLWDEYLFGRQRERLQGDIIRWPCSFDQAASLLCDAAPVKVLLFRRVTRIQTLLLRNTRSEKIERSIREALDVYDHWGRLYAPFIRDCTMNHDRLPSRIQSWYICLTGHWHLATLLLADLIEIIDDSELGNAFERQRRLSSGFVSEFRRRNCRALSDLARCACPRDDASFPKSGEYHFAVNQGALLTEPWTAVLIRAFAKAGVVLLESETIMSNNLPLADCHGDDFRRADDCVKALWYLGRKSDMALSAAKILGDVLKERQKGMEEKVNDMSSFLEAELWQGFEDLNGAFGIECV